MASWSVLLKPRSTWGYPMFEPQPHEGRVRRRDAVHRPVARAVCGEDLLAVDDGREHARAHNLPSLRSAAEARRKWRSAAKGAALVYQPLNTAPRPGPGYDRTRRLG